ncbi:MAG TPA: biosynthetic-type acetolactate synthase large subunit [Firmicutes bacterium]|nr:biosynthetic-type acetolactate synthase large subunit [Bacillota bacterium]
MKASGAEILIQALIQEGVDTIFGYPGGAVLPIYDVLYDSKIRHILTRHEQGAAHAADGYARATGRTGVCMATSGPGATNLVTGIATAYMDSVPVVAITGQVATSLLGRDSFQEADITGVTIPITKHNYLIKDAKDIPRIVKEAFYIASTGRPGPVLIDIPKDVMTMQAEPRYLTSIDLPGYKPTYKGHVKQIREAAAAINEATRPVIYAGGGVLKSCASEELRTLAEKASIPVVVTLMGLSSFPSDHPLFLGLLGMHGTAYANLAVTECDLLITLGARFSDRTTGKVEDFAPKAKVIHVDIDPAEIGKNVKVDVPVVGDLKNVLSELIPLVNPVARREWNDIVDGLKKRMPLSYQRDGNLKPQYVVEQISEVTGGEAIIATEVGQNQMWAAQYGKFTRPRSFISSGGLGTMGYGFPAAIGAQAGCPDRLVFDIAGDGSIQMNIQELATAVTYNLPVKIAILNNGYLGMVRQWQEVFYDKRYSYTSIGGVPDFVKLAEAYGAVGMRITDPADVRPAIEEAIRTPNVVVMDFRVAPEENVLPMVPPNAPINKMIGSEA